MASGCYQRYEIYGYSPNEKGFEWGTFGAKLIGTESKNDGIVIKKSPYELFLWFGSDDYINAKVKINMVKLIEAKSGKVVFESFGVPEKEIKKYSEKYRAYFSFKNIDLTHEDISLIVEFSLTLSGATKEYNVDMPLEAKFESFKRMISH